MAVVLLHQELARTVGDPFTAYVSGEVTQVSKMTNVHSKSLKNLPGLLVELSHQEPARTVGNPLEAYVSRDVTQVSSMTNVHPKSLEKLPGLLVVDISHQELIPSLCSWRRHLGIKYDQGTL